MPCCGETQKHDQSERYCEDGLVSVYESKQPSPVKIIYQQTSEGADEQYGKRVYAQWRCWSGKPTVWSCRSAIR